jgi:hypothetical protein
MLVTPKRGGAFAVGPVVFICVGIGGFRINDANEVVDFFACAGDEDNEAVFFEENPAVVLGLDDEIGHGTISLE